MAGATTDRATALVLVCAFCALLVLPALLEWTGSTRSLLTSAFHDDMTAFGLQLAMQGAERHVVFNSKFANLVRRPYQRFLIDHVGEGSRSVLVGDGMWFHRDEVLGASGPGILSPQFNQPRVVGRNLLDEFSQALRRRLGSHAAATPIDDSPRELWEPERVFEDFQARLKRSGVHLSLVMVPAKSAIYPERIWSRYPASAGPPRNTDYASFVQRAIAHGLDLVDLTTPFWTARNEFPLYLDRDTHWTPAGVDLAAKVTAPRLRPFLGAVSPQSWPVGETRVPEPMDLGGVLGLGGDPLLVNDHDIVLHVPEMPAAMRSTAPAVLLLGDSLTLYYNEQNAGFGSQLAAQLGVRVRSVFGVGDQLPSAIVATMTDPHWLDGVRVVVLEFQMNQLYARTFTGPLAPRASNSTPGATLH